MPRVDQVDGAFVSLDSRHAGRLNDVRASRRMGDVVRGRWMFVLGVVLLAALTSACGPASWPMFGYDAAHSGDSPDTTISHDALTSGSVVLDWRYDAGDLMAGAPVVSGGVVYDTSFNFDLGGMLYAFSQRDRTRCSGSPRTCTPLWTAQTVGSHPGMPAIGNGHVFVPDGVGLEVFDAAGVQGCSGSPKTCQMLWFDGFANGDAEVDPPPVVANGIVYVTSPADNTVYAFDATTGPGGPLWKTSVGGFSSPAVTNGVLYLASRGTLYAFDAAGHDNCANGTCEPLWSAATDGSSPVVANGVVYSGSGAFSAAGTTNCTGAPKTCEPLWHYSAPVLAVAHGTAFGSLGGQLMAFDAAGSQNCSGAPKACAALWAVAAGDPIAAGVANGVVYTAGGDARIRAVDSTNGSLLWLSPQLFDKQSATPLAVSDGNVYVNGRGQNTNTLYAFQLERIPPVTSIPFPPDEPLHGIEGFEMFASDNVTVTKVELHITGGSYHDAVLGTATFTTFPEFSWNFDWDTKTVPNGTYTLNSVAYDPAGNVGRSAPLTVTVHN